VIASDPDVLIETAFAFAEGFRSSAGIKALIGDVQSTQETSGRREVHVRVVPRTAQHKI
jgi:hypothetical protein